MTTKHTPFTCGDNCTKPNTCPYCAGGLILCTICHGAEGSLPTDCPGVKMTSKQEEEVYAEKIDYITGKGWVNL